MKTIIYSEPDWKRESLSRFWQPGKQLLNSIRQYQFHASRKGMWNKYRSKFCVVRHRFWSVISGADIPINSKLGGGLLIPHPNGIVIHPGSHVGVNCLIHQQVTIGVNRSSNTPPVIGDHVDIGAGAKIIGEIKVGDHALIGANAVVVKDVEPYAIVAGIPAKVFGYTNQ